MLEKFQNIEAYRAERPQGCNFNSWEAIEAMASIVTSLTEEQAKLTLLATAAGWTGGPDVLQRVVDDARAGLFFPGHMAKRYVPPVHTTVFTVKAGGRWSAIAVVNGAAGPLHRFSGPEVIPGRKPGDRGDNCPTNAAEFRLAEEARELGLTVPDPQPVFGERVLADPTAVAAFRALIEQGLETPAFEVVDDRGFVHMNLPGITPGTYHLLDAEGQWSSLQWSPDRDGRSYPPVTRELLEERGFEASVIEVIMAAVEVSRERREEKEKLLAEERQQKLFNRRAELATHFGVPNPDEATPASEPDFPNS